MTDQVIACNLDAIEADERERHFALGTQWRDAVETVEELPNGYAFRFAPNREILLVLAEFIGRERLCCPFFHFEIVVEANGGLMWLRLMGDAKVKAFIQENLGGEELPVA